MASEKLYRNTLTQKQHKNPVNSVTQRHGPRKPVHNNELSFVLSLIFMLKPLVYKSDDADRQGGDTGSQSCDKPSNTGLLVDFLYFPNIN